MLGKDVKLRYGIFVSMLAAALIAAGAWFGLSNNASAEKAFVTAGQTSDILQAMAVDDTDGDTQDKGEVQKGNIIDYYLTATYEGVGDDKSGVVTFTDILPEHMKLVTGMKEVNGKQTNCDPTIQNTGGVTWQGTPGWTYDETTRTFKAQVSNIPASAGVDSGNVVTIHIYAEVLDDAESLKIDGLYYTNYVTVSHGGANSTSNKVQFHSGNLSEQTFNVTYRFAGSTIPAGVTAPSDTSTYSKGAEMSVQPNMEAQGYTFSGWKLVTGNLTAGTYTYDEENHKFTLNKGTDSVENIVFEGTWTELSKIDITYSWQGKESTLESADSIDDKPNASEPEAAQIYENSPAKLPTYPATDDERKSSSYVEASDSYSDLYAQYEFLGWKAFVTTTDNQTTEHSFTTAELSAKEFAPSVSGKTVKSIKVTGYWVKRQFTVKFQAEKGQGPADWKYTPESLSLKWGKTFDVDTNITVEGWRFNGWRTDPDLGAGSPSTNKLTFTMPSNNVIAYASFTKTYTVTITSGTASTGAASEASKITAAAGEIVTLKPLQDMEDIRFKEWDTTVSTTANNWILQDDGTATFVMPSSDVSATGKYVMEIDFLVVNGTWLDGTKGFKMTDVAVSQTSDGTWAGTMESSVVPTGMKPDFSHKNTGKWGDGTTTAQDPNNFTGAKKITATAAGKANQLTLFTYSFNDPLDDITIKYQVKSGQSTYGSIALNQTGATSSQSLSETIDPLGVKSNPVGVTATANTGYKFSKWTRDDSEDEFSVDAKLVPFKIVNTGGTTEFYEAATYTANFEPNKFTVKFDSNKGSGSSDVTGTMDDQEIAYKSGDKLTTNAFARTGYVFTGWNTAADGKGTAYANEADGSEISTTDGDSVTLYAQWKAQTVTVNYNGVRTGISTSSTIANTMTSTTFTFDKQNQKLTANGFALTGYHFVHWSENNTAGASGIQVKAFDDAAAITNDWIATKAGTNETATVNLYTYWNANNYTVTFKPNKGSGAEEVTGAEYTQDFTYDVGQNLTDNKFKRTGYVFKGWATSAGSSTVAHGNLKSVSNLTATQDGNVDLYAVWSVQTVTVKYNSYKGNYTTGSSFTGTMTDQTVTYDNTASQTLKTNAFGLEGYKFTHWANATSSITTKYKDDKATLSNAEIAALCGTNENVTLNLYTYWTPIKFTITFNANDSVGATKVTVNTGYNNPYKQEYTYDVRQNLTSLQYNRKGYVFKGWAESADSTEVKYSNNQQNVGNLTTTDGGNINLYAIWSVQKVTVNYNGVTTGLTTSSTIQNSMTASTFTYDTTTAQALKANAFALTGYHFTHWSESNTAGASNIGKKAFDDGAAITNDWIAQKCGTGESATINLYTYWTANNYTVTFHANKGSGTEAVVPADDYTQNFTYDTAQNLTAVKYKRTGYVFKGWATSTNSTSVVHTDGKSVTNLTTVNGGNIDLYAVWQAQKLTVKFNGVTTGTGTGNYIDGSTADKVFTYDAGEQKLTKNGYSLLGYTFTHWSETNTPDGIKTAYKTDEAVISNADIAAKCGTNETAEITLYTYWTPVTYTITFDKNEVAGKSAVEGTTASMTVKYDETVNLTKNGYTRVGYTWMGWDTDKNKDPNQSTKYPDEGSVKNICEVEDESGNYSINTNITLYAIWRVNSYTIQYYGNSSDSGSMNAQSINYDETAKVLQNGFRRYGYTFTGWNTLANGSGDAYTVGQDVKNLVSAANGTFALYAQWKANDYTVKYDLNDGVQGTNPEASPSSYDDATFQWMSRGLTSGKTPTRPGYTFSRWVKKGTTTSVNTNTHYRNLRDVNAGVYDDNPSTVITLEATWTEKDAVTINYETDFSLVGNKTVGSLDKTTEQVKPATGTPTGATATVQTGYRIKEWRIKGVDGDAGKIANTYKLSKYVPTKNADLIYEAKTYVAVYENDIVDYKVKYYQEQADGTWVEPTPSEVRTFTKESNTAPAYSATDFNAGGTLAKTYSGYAATPVIKYWSNDNKGTDDGGKVGTSDVQNVAPDGSLEIRAYYPRNTYNITFDTQGHGSVTNPPANTGLRWGNKVTKPTDPVEAGWTFGGWFKEAAYTNAWSFDTLTTDANGSFTLYAKWTQNTYTVKYEVGKGSTNSSAFTDKTGVTWAQSGLLPSATPLRKGYTFKNWTVSGDTQNRAASSSSTYSALVGYINGTDKTQEITLKAVYEKDAKDNTGTKTGNVTVYANNIRMSVEEATALLAKNNAAQLSDLVAKSDAFAEQDDETPVAITQLTHTIKAQAGQYTFTLSTTGGASVTAKAFVYDKTISQVKVGIGAQNFRVSVDEVTQLKLNSATEGKQNLINLAHASAWNVITRADVGINTVNSGIQASEGEYDVTFTSNNIDGNVATITVKCTVYSKGTADQTYRITATDFSVKKGTAVTDADLITLGNAKAYEVSTGNEVEVAVKKHTPEFDANKVGQYSLTYYVKGTDGFAEVDVIATVYDDAVEKDGEIISANGFSIAKDQVASLTDAKLIELANAKAYEKATGKAVTVTVKDRSALKAEKGTYQVTFTTAKGAETTIDVKVTDNETTQDGIRISANDFTISVDEVKNNILKGSTTPDKDALTSYAKASATKASDNSDIGIGSVTSTPALEAKKGTYVLTFTSNTLDGKTAVTTCKMIVNDNSGIQNGIRVDANDFTVSVQQVKDEGLSGGTSANLANLIKRAKATASLEVDGTKVDITGVNSGIKAEKGTYEVTFTATYGDKTAQATVHVTVTDNSGDSGDVDDPDAIKIDANGFTLSVAEATTLAGQTGDAKKKALIDYAQATASKISDGSAIEISEATTTVQGKKGEYTATFKATNNGKTAEITVTVKVVDNADRDNKDVDIFASGFSVTAKQVTDEKLNNNTEGLQALIKYANASAVLKKDQSNVGIASVDSKIRAEKGTYDVTFTSNVPDGGTAATVTVKVKVTDNKTVTDDGLTISANNFTVSVEEAKTLGATNPDKDKLIQLANAHAEDKTGANIGIASVTSTIEAKVGTYKVTFTSNKVNGKDVSQEVTATVRDDAAASDTIKLDANNFTVSVDEVKTHKLNSGTEGKAKLIAFAHAHAELISDGTFVEIASVNSTIQPKVGTYKVTFTTAAPTGTTAVSLEVEAKVVSSAVDPDPDDKDGVRAYATDFSISKADVEANKLHESPLTDAAKSKLIELAKARAEKVLDSSVVDIDKNSITSEIKAEKGRYKVTFTSVDVNGKTATAVAWAQVTDDSSSGEITDPDNPDKINLTANNFDMSIADAKALNNLGNNEKLAKLIEYAKAYAYLESDGSAVDIISAAGTILAEKGTYKITFKTATIKGASAELSVWATVNTNSGGSEDIDDPNKPGSKDKINIYASDFSVSINDVTKDNLSGASASLENLVARAKARAEMASDGRAVKVASVTSAIKAVKGTYDVTFTSEAVSGKTASITIKATVTDETGGSGEITDPDPDRPSGTDKINIYANDFSVSAKDVTAKSLNNGTTALAELIKLANARAEWASDGASIEVVKADSEIKAAKGTYKVTFTSKAFKNTSASVSIWATVTDDSGSSGEITDPDVPGGKDMINIYANDFDISVKDVEAMKKLDANGQLNALIGYAKARANFASNGAAVDVVSAETEIAAAKGTYDVKFTSKAYNNIAASIIIKATVTDDSGNSGEITDPDRPGGKDTINIYANDFSVSVKDVTAKNLTDNTNGLHNLIDLAKARAEWKSDGSAVNIASVDSQIKAAKGTYEVTFTSEAFKDKSASITVKATVTDGSSSGGEVVDPDYPDPTDPDAPKVKINIYANDFSVSVKDVENNNLGDNTNGKDKLIELAKARAEYSKDGSNVEIASVDSAIEAKKGTYTVKFTSAAKGNVPAAEVTVNATVTDSSSEDSGDTPEGKKDGVRAYANNFTVSVKEVENGNLGDATASGVLDSLVKYAKARAERVMDGSVVDIASATSAIEAAKGEYDVTFTSAEVAGKTSTVSVKARVVDYADRGDVTDPDNPNPDPDRSDKISIFANDFNLSVGEVESIFAGGTTITSDVAAALVKHAGARAELIADQSDVEIVTVETDMVAKKGTYDVKFTSQEIDGKHASVTVKATVTDSADRGNTADIFANDFTVSVAEVKADKLTDASADGVLDKLIKRAGAYAADKFGKAVDIVKAESSILAKGGKYDVEFTSAEVNGEAISIKIKATVKDAATEDTTNGERITANNFSLSMEEAAAIVDGTTSATDAKNMLISLANAEASNIADGSPIEIVNVDYTTLKAEVANYKITFATAKGTSVTVLAKVSDNVVVVGNVAVDAHDFTVSIAEVTSLKLDDGAVSKDTLVSLAEAKAWDTNTKEPIDFSEVVSAIQAKRGDYDVTFTATNGTDTNSKTITASVKNKKVDPSNPDPKPDPDPDNPDQPKPSPDPDQPTPDPDEDVDIEMYGNDFAVSVQEVEQFNLTNGDVALDKLIELADAEARKKSDNNVVKIVKATSTIQAKVGDYTVEFETEPVDDKTVKMEVNVRVFSDSSVTPDPDDPDNSIAMYASDFMSWREEAEAIAKGTVISKDNGILKAFADGVELNDGQKELIRLGAVVAYNTKDASEVDITDVTFPYDDKTGDYTVTFIADTGKVTAKLSVTDTVTDEGSESVENQERIFANNISYTYAEAEELLAKSNDEIATQLAIDAKAAAVSTVDWSSVDVTDAEWNIQAAEGVYDVTFSTEKGTTVKVKAAVGEKPLDPSALAALSKTGDNMFVYVALAVLIVLISSIAVVFVVRKRRKQQ